MIKQIKYEQFLRLKPHQVPFALIQLNRAALGPCEHECHITITLALFADSTEASKAEIKSSYGSAQIKFSCLIWLRYKGQKPTEEQAAPSTQKPRHLHAPTDTAREAAQQGR